MTIKLFFGAIFKFLLGVLLVGLLVFLPAGSLYYLNGWIFMGVLFIPMFIAGIVMMFVNPKLLQSRLDAKEKQKDQNLVIKLSGLMFIAGFIVAGLDYRFTFIKIPQEVSYIASLVFLLGYVLYGVVLKQNKYLSRTIKVEDEQKVISTGLYSVVRHPMYTATIVLFLSMPLVLGSLVSFFIFLVYPILIAFRAVKEEQFLMKELPGYNEYLKKGVYIWKTPTING